MKKKTRRNNILQKKSLNLGAKVYMVPERSGIIKSGLETLMDLKAN